MGRKHRRRHRSYRSRHREYSRRRRNGWGLGLYRNTRDGKIAGVCAGLADHWEVEHWVVRLLAVVLFLFTGTLALWAYIAGWILMARRSDARRSDARPADSRSSDGRRSADYYSEEDREYDLETEYVEMEYDERQHNYRPRKIFRYSESPSVRLQRARERLDAALGRVENMESYVTSRQFELNKEFSKL
jgi:phage shock protein C